MQKKKIVFKIVKSARKWTEDQSSVYVILLESIYLLFYVNLKRGR